MRFSLEAAEEAQPHSDEAEHVCCRPLGSRSSFSLSLILAATPKQDYFVDGVTESLTTDLSRMIGGGVIARNTAFSYKSQGLDVRQIGRDLRVRHILEG